MTDTQWESGEVDKAESSSAVECRADLLARQNFNSAQSSQLFINCCFAVSFGGVFYVTTEAIKKSVLLLVWTLLSLYVLFFVWRQYSNYLIPLQFHRNELESNWEEGITLAITFVLALLPVICLYLPHWSLLPLFAVVVLNIWKLAQMKRAIRQAPNFQKAKLAFEQLSVFNIKLWIHLRILFLLIALVAVYQHLLTNEVVFAWVVTAVSVIVNFFVVPWIYKNVDGLGRPDLSLPNAQEYVDAIASAWPHRK